MSRSSSPRSSPRGHVVDPRHAAGAEAVRIVTVNGTDEELAALKDARFAATVANSAADTANGR
ncbi:hypothetical protein [Streptomyces sp. P17]|uniref:hypothetical protein n=1 Tax=Streptomyces sp. P17 TaxID=3074716 RepID=UPI0028F441FB|nr:hypothetical protein [Streptomyces sp. P17]MDT9694792.1 hypothetical protein [Streptomyces sp. P17]